MLLLRDFNRRFTIRRLSMFGEPEVLPITQLSFPKNSVLHYFNPKAVEIGPPGTLYKLNEYEKVPRIRHHQYMPQDGTVGLPIENKLELKESILLYHRKWKTMGRLKQMSIVQNESKILLIENYLPILKKYRYNERINLWHDIAHNQLNTVFTGLRASIEELPERQHYIPVSLPNVLPAKSKLKKMIFQRTKQVWGDLGSYEMLLLVELYSFIGETKERENSIFYKLTPREIKHINFVFEFRGNFVVLNLGEIDGWRRDGNVGKVFPEEMQKRMRLTIQRLLEIPPVVVAEQKLTLNDTPLRPNQDEVFEEEQDYQDSEETIDEEIRRFNEEVSVEVNDEEEIVVEEKEEEEVHLETPETTIDFVKRELEKIKKISPARYEKFNNAFNQVEDLESPYGGNYKNNLVISKEEAEIKRKEFLEDDSRITVKSWNGSRTKEYGETFCTKILPKEIVRTCYSAQQMGFVIDGHSMEEELSASGHKEHHKLHVTLLDGKKATLPFTIPKVDKHGYWTSNGVKYTMRKQRTDLPIRKVGPTEVALTTFYGKCFIQTNEHKVNNWTRWAVEEIALASESDVPTITDVSYSNVYDNEADLPREFSLIAQEIDSFNANGYHYNFDHKRIDKMFGVETVEKLAKDGLTPIAKTRGKLLAMDKSSAMYEVVGDKITPAERLSVQLGLPIKKEPKEFSEVKILRSYVPLILFFGFHYGLEGALKRFKTEYHFIPPGDKADTDEGIVLKLKEGRLVIRPKSRTEELIFNALLRYKDVIKELSLHELNSQAAYNLLLAKDKLGSEYISEFINIEKGFVDAYHRDILKSMGEPTNFTGLLIRANEMMDNPMHPKETDIDYMHILSHHRFAGHIYKEIAMSVRRYHNAPPNIRKLELKPKAVWTAISSDTSVLTAQDSTPIQSIKEADVVTFSGTNGRSRRSMVKRTRELHASELGIVSGDTVDSTDVGITAMLANDANIVDVFGNVATTKDVESLDYGELMSFCNSIAPDVDTDDSKRSAFVGIQMGSATAAKGATCPAYRTPSHMMVAHRASDSYSVAAREDGKVVEVTDFGITVAFKDGKRESYPLSRWYGSYEGGTYPHDMATTFKAGDKVKKNDILTYSPNHFEPDFYKPRQVNWKAGVMATGVLLNSQETHEDSDEIAEWLSEALSHDGTKVKDVTLDVTQHVATIINVGAKVEYETLLCLIDEAEDSGELSADTMEVLSDIAAQAPKAGLKGIVDRIEVLYNAEYEEMSESIQAIARKGDRQRRIQAKNSPTPMAETGKVDSDYRVSGNPLTNGKIVIRFYITTTYTPRGASKLVFGNQMKSVIKGIMVGKNYLEDGRNIDFKFGRQGVDDRIVGSFSHIMLKGLFCHELGRECREIRDS